MLSAPGYSGAPPSGSLHPGAQLIHGPYGYQIVGLPSFQAAPGGQPSLTGLDSAPSGGGTAGSGQSDEGSAAGGGGGGNAAGGPQPPPPIVPATVNTISNNNNNNIISSSHLQHAEKGQQAN